MSSYVEENLAPGEHPLYEAKLHWIAMAFPVFLSLPFLADGFYLFMFRNLAPGLILFALGALILCWSWIRMHSFEFAVTNLRIVYKRGVFGRDTDELFLTKVESIHIRQSPLGRIFDYGAVRVRGTGASWERFRSISRPLELRHLVQSEILSAATPVMPSSPAAQSAPAEPVRQVGFITPRAGWLD